MKKIHITRVIHILITPRQNIKKTNNIWLIHIIIYIEYNMDNMLPSTLYNMGAHLGSQTKRRDSKIYILIEKERKIYSLKMRKKEE